MLKEAKRLYDLGLAVHWIKPNSKAPVKSGWSGPKRDNWGVVQREYQRSYGLGVRLGESSHLGIHGYLANIDVDIKSNDSRHFQEAMALVHRLFGGLASKAPTVKTGYGLRIFVRTAAPMPSGKLGSSNEETLVLMPTAPINKRQLAAVKEGKLTEKQLRFGYRIRPAWEVEFMSIGKQVVLPPSIHPETGKKYQWELFPLESVEELPLVECELLGKSVKPSEPSATNFKVVEVEMDGRLWPGIKAMIETGDGVTDRSEVLAVVCERMCLARFTDDEILTVLTDDSLFLGQASRERRRNRQAAGRWLRQYYLDKARAATAELFADEVPGIRGKEKGGGLRLKRTQAGGIKHTLGNVVAILAHIAKDVFKRDLFANRDFYGCNTPWGGVSGAALTDDDAVQIKLWIGASYGFEPAVGTVFEAMVAISTHNAFHPVREELLALPAWDGVNRLDGWLKENFGAQGPADYLAQVFTKWMVASVARTFEPGLKFDWMIILQGNQGTGKSTFGSLLFGQKYFTDWLPVLSDKDAALALQGIRCVEFGEMDQLKRTELETTKAFVTRQIDKVRPPYGRRQLELHRQTVFFGTTNREEYLKDDTGNRRFNPVVVGRLNFKALIRDRIQLWAEALFIYRNGLGTSLYLEGEAEIFSKVIQSEKMVGDDSIAMAEDIREHFGKDDSNFNYQKFSMKDLFGTFGPLAENWKWNHRNAQFAAKALKFLGAKKAKSNGFKVWRFKNEPKRG